MKNTEVLIAGAGPTGLVLALWLTRIGVKVRIIDKTERAGTTSRATIMHARNLEYYRQMGFSDDAVSDGAIIHSLSMWVGGKKKATAQFRDFDKAITPYQFILGFPQDHQEALLEKQLAAAGVTVERRTELVSFTQNGDGVTAEILLANGEKETCTARYLAGCDGAHSVVRQQLNVGFPGGTYEETYYVADIVATAAFDHDEINIALDKVDFLAAFPFKGENTMRLVGTIRPGIIDKKDLKWEDVSGSILERLKMNVKEVNWFSTYKVHHRVASHFHEGNAFLLGDAGHIHSPVGGQGLNTGIGDAVNLAWKIGAVLRDNAPKSILDTYETERIAFARQLVATTDKAFTFINKKGGFATWVRTRVAPVVLPWLFRITAVRRFMFLLVSQIEIRYTHSTLSSGAAGNVQAGTRLPWVPFDAADPAHDNFTPLTSMWWQVHSYGDGLPERMQQLCDQRKIPVHIFPWSDRALAAGLKKDAVYLVRPDGYVGLAAEQTDYNKLAGYLDKWHISKP
jgi:2-polyprenyl-6-methoxyphenol hydroxylase-like FAD-dependent oxidoreductase